MHQPGFVVVLTVALLPLAAPAAARQAPPLSLDLTLGISHGNGGEYVNRTGVAADALLAGRFGSLAGAAAIGGVHAGVHGALAGTDVCHIGPGGGCMPDFPLFVSLGAAGGVQFGTPTGNTRVLAGPVYVRDADEGDAGLGVQGRLEAALPLRRLRVVASLRATLLPEYRGDTLGVGALAVGVRFD